jgi:hypothetical protein
MTATYDVTQVATSPLFEVRLILGDNITSGTTDAVLNAKVQDEEIAYFLNNEANVYLAAAASAETISARYASLVRKTVGPLTVDYAAQAQNYASLAARLRERGQTKGGTGAPVFGGISYNAKEHANDNPDFAGTAIRVGIMDGYIDDETGFTNYSNGY